MAYELPTKEELRMLYVVASLRQRADAGPAVKLLRSGGSIDAALREALADFLDGKIKRPRGRPSSTPMQQLLKAQQAFLQRAEINAGDTTVKRLAEKLHRSPKTIADRLARPNRTRRRNASGKK